MSARPPIPKPTSDDSFSAGLSFDDVIAENPAYFQSLPKDKQRKMVLNFYDKEVAQKGVAPEVALKSKADFLAQYVPFDSQPNALIGASDFVDDFINDFGDKYTFGLTPLVGNALDAVLPTNAPAGAQQASSAGVTGYNQLIRDGIDPRSLIGRGVPGVVGGIVGMFGGGAELIPQATQALQKATLPVVGNIAGKTLPLIGDAASGLARAGVSGAQQIGQGINNVMQNRQTPLGALADVGITTALAPFQIPGKIADTAFQGFAGAAGGAASSIINQLSEGQRINPMAVAQQAGAEFLTGLAFGGAANLGNSGAAKPIGLQGVANQAPSPPPVKPGSTFKLTKNGVIKGPRETKPQRPYSPVQQHAMAVNKGFIPAQVAAQNKASLNQGNRNKAAERPQADPRTKETVAEVRQMLELLKDRLELMRLSGQGKAVKAAKQYMADQAQNHPNPEVRKAYRDALEDMDPQKQQAKRRAEKEAKKNQQRADQQKANEAKKEQARKQAIEDKIAVEKAKTEEARKREQIKTEAQNQRQQNTAANKAKAKPKPKPESKDKPVQKPVKSKAKPLPKPEPKPAAKKATPKPEPKKKAASKPEVKPEAKKPAPKKAEPKPEPRPKASDNIKKASNTLYKGTTEQLKGTAYKSIEDVADAKQARADMGSESKPPTDIQAPESPVGLQLGFQKILKNLEDKSDPYQIQGLSKFDALLTKVKNMAEGKIVVNGKNLVGGKQGTGFEKAKEIYRALTWRQKYKAKADKLSADLADVPSNVTELLNAQSLDFQKGTGKQQAVPESYKTPDQLTGMDKGTEARVKAAWEIIEADKQAEISYIAVKGHTAGKHTVGDKRVTKTVTPLGFSQPKEGGDITLHAINEDGHINSYKMSTKTASGGNTEMRVTKKPKMLDFEGQRGVTPNMAKGPREFKIDDILSRTPREELTSISELNKQALDVVDYSQRVTNKEPVDIKRTKRLNKEMVEGRTPKKRKQMFKDLDQRQDADGEQLNLFEGQDC